MEREEGAIRSAALDYMDGDHEGNADRIARSVHAELSKVSVRKLSQTGKDDLYKAGFSRLAELAQQLPVVEDPGGPRAWPRAISGSER